MFVTRFAPSPTGFLHLGGVRTALFAFLLARRAGGRFLLRIEDTDHQRSHATYTQQIIDALEWLGIRADGSPVIQSENIRRHQEFAHTLLKEGKAYHCYATPEELEAMRASLHAKNKKFLHHPVWREGNEAPPNTVQPVIRFKVPKDSVVSFEDKLFGGIHVASDEIEDFVIVRSDGMPTYHLSCVVDDNDMAVNHVVRGDDHINNTSKHILLQQALGFDVPSYLHLPMILDEEGRRLSKRSKAADVLGYKRCGYLPDALVNYLVRLGWAKKDEELFSMQDLLNDFNISGLNRSAAKINPKKLNWLNQHYIQSSSPQQLWTHLQSLDANISDCEKTFNCLRLIQKRAKNLVDIQVFLRSFNADDQPKYNVELVEKWYVPRRKDILQKIEQALNKLEVWSVESIAVQLKRLVEEEGIRFPQLAQNIRLSVFGHTDSPAIDGVIFCLGACVLTQKMNAFIRHLDALPLKER